MEGDSEAVLIAVKSSAGDCSMGHNQVIRDTWARQTRGVPVWFFVGRGTMPINCDCADEVRVDAPDGYYALPFKTAAMLRHVLSLGRFRYVFICDVDTFVRPEKLFESGFERCDVMGLYGHRDPGQREKTGRHNREDGPYGWPSGGGGYWLSMKAAQVFVNSDREFKMLRERGEWAEDRMVGQILGPYIQRGELKAVNRLDYGAPETSLSLVTSHYCARGFQRDYDPQWMRDMYRKHYPNGAR